MKNKGFTLIEVTIAVVILGIVATIGATVLYESVMAGNASRDFINASWQTRLVLQRMTSELRAADNISAANSNNITFHDLNNDITYAYSGTNITRDDIKIADDVGSLTFTYFDANNQTTAILGDIHCINIAVQITAGSNPINVATMVCPRNLL
jgi:prepilin-type N-terminal cleavage/methylation domain-containing protein